MQQRIERSDVVVVGGGLAGVNAAVAAARLGATVSLATNRPVLGGNSSSEVRVWVVGATAHGTQRFARETGIMGELFLENQYRNPEGNPYYWDQTVLDLVRAEPNITLHLNTDVRTVEMDGDRIASVTGWTMGSEIETRFEAPIVLDCTGDGLIGHLAGASYRVGREARDEFGEPWAPEAADDELLGSSIFFYTKDAGRPERFVPPSIAKDIGSTPILANRIIRTGDNGCDYWWIEWGGELDTVHENERIRDELWSVVFGIWDHIKNSGEFDAERLTLEWVGSVPGKREYRRFVGDHTLTQLDLLEQRRFPDAVAFGGWSIDLHPVEGVYAETTGAHQRYSDGTYEIPFRSLYSANVSNLLFAGRNISASHVAFGSTRVMATCATQGQAAGTAAALASGLRVTPRELGTQHLDTLLRTLHREDAPVMGLAVEDTEDLARQATVRASSSLDRVSTLAHATGETLPLDRDYAVVVPVDPRLDAVRLRVDAPDGTPLQVELWDPVRPQNYAPIRHISSVTATVEHGVAEARFDWQPESPQNAVIVIRRQEGAALERTDGHPYGVLLLARKMTGDAAFDEHIPDADDQPVTDWVARGLRGSAIAMEVSPASAAYAPERVVDGLQRPFGGPHLWSSNPVDDPTAAGEWVELSWDEPQTIGQVRVVLNDDVDADLINLHHHRTDFEAVPQLVRDYTLEVREGDAWRTVAEVTGNRHRHRVHDLPESVVTDALRLTVTATNGSPHVTVASIKAFAAPSARTTSGWGT